MARGDFPLTLTALSVKTHAPQSLAESALFALLRGERLMGMDKFAALGLTARHALTFVGGYLASKGHIQQADIEPLVGAVLLIGGIVWSVVQKHRSAKP